MKISNKGFFSKCDQILLMLSWTSYFHSKTVQLPTSLCGLMKLRRSWDFDSSHQVLVLFKQESIALTTHNSLSAAHSGKTSLGEEIPSLQLLCKFFKCENVLLRCSRQKPNAQMMNGWFFWWWGQSHYHCYLLHQMLIWQVPRTATATLDKIQN